MQHATSDHIPASIADRDASLDDRSTQHAFFSATTPFRNGFPHLSSNAPANSARSRSAHTSTPIGAIPLFTDPPPTHRRDHVKPNAARLFIPPPLRVVLRPHILELAHQLVVVHLLGRLELVQRVQLPLHNVHIPLQRR